MIAGGVVGQLAAHLDPTAGDRRSRVEHGAAAHPDFHGAASAGLDG